MVFQDYALFPHMTVAQNVGYGLPRSGAGNRRRVADVLELLHALDNGYERLPTATGPTRTVGVARRGAARAESLIPLPAGC